MSALFSGSATEACGQHCPLLSCRYGHGFLNIQKVCLRSQTQRWLLDTCPRGAMGAPLHTLTTLVSFCLVQGEADASSFPKQHLRQIGR